MRKLYFSLLELLITIGIIAILAGMLLPVLNSVREKGMLVQCISHQKQIGLGIIHYVDDEVFYPWEIMYFWNRLTGYKIDGINSNNGVAYLQPYKSKISPGLIQPNPQNYCVKHEQYRTSAGSVFVPWSYIPQGYHSGLKTYGISGEKEFPDSARTPVQIKSPSTKIAVLEGPARTGNISYYNSYNDLHNPDNPETRIAPVHETYVTGWFYDGHVKSLNVLNELLYDNDVNTRKNRWSKLFPSNLP